ncbi:caspase family protein [Streptomyces sp. HD]|uniref:caspase family protein n=1 Tax=Streptomyces sp. HD TaxID=3020892 RepID=UPI00232E21CF|nr:caspase family protein [Streptomyces sp. HD]MDC0773746.1 caspase family protein [Streptomyces sp. HD]
MKRYLVAAGTRHYREAAELPLAHEDVERAAELFTSMGYDRVLTAVSYDPDSESFENALADWCGTPGLSGEDVIVVYYAGHGDRSPAGQYRLACADSELGRPRSWLSLPNLAEILATSPLRNVLFVVDACHAAAATTEIGTVTDTIVAGRGRADAFGGGTWLLASARHRDLAVDGAFVTELAKACAQGDGPSQRHLAPSTLAERVNRSFLAAGLAQRAACSSVDQSERPPFFGNPFFEPHAEITGDGQAQGDASDLSSHFEPRGRGVEHVHDPGSYFTGRGRALKAARAHLDGEGEGRILVVTADPGSGKSAVLGRLVLEGCADASVNAHHQTLEALVGRIAAAADVRAATPVALFTTLADRRRPLRIVVDSLDEAGPAGDKAEARRIAWELLRPLAAVACVRLVVGSRRELLPHLGGQVPVIDLDDSGYAQDTDPAAYVTKILSDAGAPYEHHPEVARRVAHEVARRAGRCFLVARMTASALLRGPVVDTSAPGWAEQLPSDVGGAFEVYLQRLPQERHPKTIALLTSLAFGEGSGLPRRLWARVATRVSGIALVQADIDLLLDEDGSYLAQAEVNGTKYFRLYHQELTDHLKWRALNHRDLADLQECFVETLLELVPDRDWSRAHPYVRSHLATHAAASGELDDLIEDASFVVHADPTTLLPAVRRALRRPMLAMAVERYAYLVTGTDATLLDRPALLAFVAETYGEHAVAGQAQEMSDVLEGIRVEPREITPHQVVGRHDGDAYMTRAYNPNWKMEYVTLPDGGRVVLAAPPLASHVHVWRLDNPSQSTILPHPASVVGLALLIDGTGGARAVTLDARSDIRVWNVADQTLTHTVTSGATLLFEAGFRSDGTPVLVCGETERVVVYSLPLLEQLVEVDCETIDQDSIDRVGPSACLAHFEDGQVRLLLCDGVRGRVTLHSLDGDGDVTVLLKGLAQPVLADHIHAGRGTVAAVCEPRTRLTLLNPGSGRTVPMPFSGFAWQENGFALGSEDSPVFVAQDYDDLLIASLDAPPQRVAARDKPGGHASFLAPVLLSDGLYAATVGYGSPVQMVDCATADAVGSTLCGHEGAVCSLHLLPSSEGSGPDILAVGNDGTARMWRWDEDKRPGEPRSSSAALSAPEIESLVPWPPDSPGVIAVSGRVSRHVAPAPEPEHGTTFSLVDGLTADEISEQTRSVDPGGTLHLLSWEYTGHVKPEHASDLPGWPSSVPHSYAVWHRVVQGTGAEATHLTWLHGDSHIGVQAHLLPPTDHEPRTRFLGLDAILGHVGLLAAPDADPDGTDLPWPVDPSHDWVCSAAFTTSSGSTVLMTGMRRTRLRESSVGGRSTSPEESGAAAEQPPGATDGRLWDMSTGAPDQGTPIELLDDVWLLLPHHTSAGTRWVAQQGRDGTTQVIDLSTDHRNVVRGSRPDGDLLVDGHRTLVSGTDFFIRWTELCDGSAVLLLLDPTASDDAHTAPVTVWDSSHPDAPHRLAVAACRLLWTGRAPSGRTLVAVSDEHGVALCDLPSGEKIWSVPLPALVTSLTALPASRALDLAVGTQQGVVFLRPRLSRVWRDRLGVG